MKDELIILAIYINVDGMSRQHTEKVINNFMEYINDSFSDTKQTIKTIVLPITDGQPTKIECVYPNNNYKAENGAIIDIYEELLKHEYNDISMNNLKIIIRRLKIKKLLKRSL